MVTPAAHREAAAYLQQTYEMSQRRACQVIGGDRFSVRYQAPRTNDGELRERLKALAAGGLAIGGCTCFCGVRAMRSTRSAFSVCTARSG
jgi:hypothetical protein